MNMKMEELDKTIVVTGLMMVDGARKGFLRHFIDRLMESAPDKIEMMLVIKSAGELLDKKTILREEAEKIGLAEISSDMQMSENELSELINLFEQSEGDMEKMIQPDSLTASFSA